MSTASRAPTWALACSLHAELFAAARDAGNIAVQLAYYGGLDFHTTDWSATPSALLERMLDVRCVGGRTQILRLLRHVSEEARRHPLRALVFIGDCFEEDADQAIIAAGELAVFGVPAFIFQEGSEYGAGEVFGNIARLTGGAHVPFRPGSADDLRNLLRAVATFASGGRGGLERSLANPMSSRLLTQLPP